MSISELSKYENKHTLFEKHSLHCASVVVTKDKESTYDLFEKMVEEDMEVLPFRRIDISFLPSNKGCLARFRKINKSDLPRISSCDTILWKKNNLELYNLNPYRNSEIIPFNDVLSVTTICRYCEAIEGEVKAGLRTTLNSDTLSVVFEYLFRKTVLHCK